MMDAAMRASLHLLPNREAIAIDELKLYISVSWLDAAVMSGVVGKRMPRFCLFGVSRKDKPRVVS